MTIKHVAVSAAMAIFAGTMICGAGPAQADEITYKHICSFDLMAPDKTTDGPISIYAYFITSKSEASVKADQILIENGTDRDIIVDVNRWQPEDGMNPDDRGPAFDIPSGLSAPDWYPTSYFSFDKNPSIIVHAYAKTSPGLAGSGMCPARPMPG